MVLMVKSGSSCRPSCRYAKSPAAMKAIMKYQMSERCPRAQSERLKVFMAWRPVRCVLAVSPQLQVSKETRRHEGNHEIPDERTMPEGPVGKVEGFHDC